MADRLTVPAVALDTAIRALAAGAAWSASQASKEHARPAPQRSGPEELRFSSHVLEEEIPASKYGRPARRVEVTSSPHRADADRRFADLMRAGCRRSPLGSRLGLRPASGRDNLHVSRATRLDLAHPAGARDDGGVSASPVPLTGLLPEGSEWVPVTHGQSGAAVLHDAATERYVKVVPAAHADALAAERDRIEWLSATGIPGPTVLAWRTSEHGASLVTSAVAGVPADQLDPTQLHAAWPSITDTVRRLHSIRTASCPYDRTLDDLIAVARATVARNRVHTEFLPQHLQQTPPAVILESLERELPRRRDQAAADPVVCHGDLCLPNILIDPGTLQVTGLIDLGRLGCADPYVDIALLLANARGAWPDEVTARQADHDFADRYGIVLDPERRDFHLRLDPLTW